MKTDKVPIQDEKEDDTVPRTPNEEDLQTATISISLHPELYKLLEKKAKKFMMGGVRRYIRHLVSVDLSQIHSFQHTPFIRRTKNKRIIIKAPRYMVNELEKRAEQCMSLGQSDYVRMLIYANLIASGDIGVVVDTATTKVGKKNTIVQK